MLLRGVQERGVSFGFECLNAGKRSLCIDAKKHREEVLELLRGADVFITNVRSHQLKPLGLDYDTLRLEAPQLVVAQINAWGCCGPDRELPGYDVSVIRVRVICAVSDGKFGYRRSGRAQAWHTPSNPNQW